MIVVAIHHQIKLYQVIYYLIVLHRIFIVPIANAIGIYSFQCCDQCAPSCSGRFVHRVCLNRTTMEQTTQFSCSLIPSLPISAYLDWAISNCSQVGCSSWSWSGEYNL